LRICKLVVEKKRIAVLEKISKKKTSKPNKT